MSLCVNVENTKIRHGLLGMVNVTWYCYLTLEHLHDDLLECRKCRDVEEGETIGGYNLCMFLEDEIQHHQTQLRSQIRDLLAPITPLGRRVVQRQ